MKITGVVKEGNQAGKVKWVTEAKTIITHLVCTGVHVNNYPLEISLPGISSSSTSPACSA